MNDSFYTTGEFSKRANISVRTIRYYDQKGLLKPSLMKDSGYRYYTDRDFASLQRILVLKKLGFALEEIKEITINSSDASFVKESLQLQQKLIGEKIAELRQMEQMLNETSALLSQSEEPDWSQIVGLIHLLNMEETLLSQYKTSKNLKVRIDLHRKYAQNPLGWYPWICSKLPIRENQNILEVGCGNGELWREMKDSLPKGASLLLSDISSGMLRSAAARLKGISPSFSFEQFDMQNIPYEDNSFDLVIANHVLFYARDRKKALGELYRVLKKGGCLCLSTYGRKHMKEIEELAKEYDEQIALSEVKLYDIFGLDEGAEELKAFFQTVEKYLYEDSLLVTDIRPLADYIYSCHGNQMSILKDREQDFEKFLTRKLGKKGLSVTKDAGIFCCIK
ncbi:Methylase involved in ubiquinone/menaquinone biosynthesis [Anaerocolumna jejuensis DSM 15929]|uniref:Methylase involved in ubiquinone/menaquinone biosynthesis n=1 Tax=Anaerocolumna jejuensis DSM 15929 TaxID=1121322 RepID=A0A1M6PLT2_9FIRM|nr:methyltransferase domain-containing protein [Anaerocolumna jejuensis]SHK08909.1 Methylase involved in ubiquinone/menaquinone biosynthesis [Anaerocolumna jejuensis DSM 15929]